MKKTYTEMIEEISQQEIDELYEYALLTEKNMSKDEVADLIDSAISVATKVKNDPKKSDKHKTTASSVLSMFCFRWNWKNLYHELVTF